LARAANAQAPSLFFASAEAGLEQLDAVRDTMLKTLETLGEVPFTADEVERAKVRSKRNAETLAANSSGMAQSLSSASAIGDWRLLFIQPHRIAAARAADVDPVGKTNFPRHHP